MDSFVQFRKYSMRNKNSAGIACIVLSIPLAYLAIKNSFVTPTIPFDDPSGLGVSRMVGAFLPFLVSLSIGLWLLTKKTPPSNS